MTLPALSVRARLALGNVLILALILGVLGGLLRYGAQVWLSADLDRDLASSARRIARRPAPLPTNPPQTPRTRSDTASSETDPAFRYRPKVLTLERKRLVSGEPDTPYDERTFDLAAQGQNPYSVVPLNGDKVRVYSLPITRDGKLAGVVQTARSMQEMEAELGRLTRMLLMLLPVALLAAGVGGLTMTQRVLLPIRSLTQAAGRIEAQSLSERLPAEGRDEFSLMAYTFNAMLARLEQAFLRQRRFTAAASHELRTPLAAIKGDVSLALSGSPRSAEEYRHTLETVNASADRMSRIVQDLLLLARSDEGHLTLDLQVVVLSEVISQAVSTLRAQHAEATIRQDIPQDLWVVGDTLYLERLFSNLLENAARHTPPEETIIITAHPNGAEVMVRVIDTGEGIAPEHLSHVFESFYRADTARSRVSGGTGLGLAICKSIVEAHGGSVSIESAVGKGTTVTVTLPSARLSATEA